MKLKNLVSIAAIASLLSGIGVSDVEARRKSSPKGRPTKARQVPQAPSMRDQLPNKADDKTLTVYFPTNS